MTHVRSYENGPPDIDRSGHCPMCRRCGDYEDISWALKQAVDGDKSKLNRASGFPDMPIATYVEKIAQVTSDLVELDEEVYGDDEGAAQYDWDMAYQKVYEWLDVLRDAARRAECDGDHHGWCNEHARMAAEDAELDRLGL